MKAKSKIGGYIAHSVAAAMVMVSAQSSLAGSSTWLQLVDYLQRGLLL